jgi:hypothetical protein
MRAQPASAVPQKVSRSVYGIYEFGIYEFTGTTHFILLHMFKHASKNEHNLIKLAFNSCLQPSARLIGKSSIGSECNGGMYCE